MKQILGQILFALILIGGAYAIVEAHTPLQVRTEPDRELVLQACRVGYIGKIKQVTTDLVVDAYVYCEEKYP